jgi:hypothetical protein
MHFERSFKRWRLSAVIIEVMLRKLSEQFVSFTDM